MTENGTQKPLDQHGYYALVVDIDPKNGFLRCRAAEIFDASEIIDRIRRALRDFGGRCRRDTSANQHGKELLRIAEIPVADLRRDLRRFSEDALELFDSVEAASKELIQAARDSGLERDPALVRLIDSLRNHSSEIAASSPEVVATLRKRSEVDLALLKAASIKSAVSLCLGMRSDSEGRFHVLTSLAIAKILDPAVSEREKQSAYYFMKAMLPRAAVAVVNDEASGTEKPKKKSLGKKVLDAADAAAKIDKGVDALQENIPEATNWASEVYSQIASGNFFGLMG